MKEPKRNAGSQNAVTEMKNTFDELASRQDRTKEGICELEDIPMGMSKIEIEREKRMYKMKQNTQEQGRNSKMYNIFVMIIPGREKGI